MVFILILALASVIFICLEIILPGMVLGIAGIVALVASLTLTFSTGDLDGMGFGGRALIASCILFVCLALIALWLKYFDRTPLGRKLVLRTSGKTYMANADPELLLGAKGESLTDLRPTGKVAIDGLPKTCYVIAETGFIEAGSKIEIIKIDGRRVLVRQTT